MPVVRIDLEINNQGGAKIVQTSGQLKDLGQNARSAGDAIKNGFLERIGHQALDALVAALRAVPAALTDSVRATIDYGSHLTDMEARTGVVVEAQQELDHAAKLVGLTFEGDVVPALAKMQKALVDTPEKFERLGLSVTELRKLKPDEQFQAIAEAIAKIKDPAERSAAAIEIFGKSGASLLPLLTSNIKAAREEAEQLGLVMSKDVAHSADDLGDSLDTLSQVFDGFVHNIGAAIVTSEPLHVLIEGLTKILADFSREVHGNQGELRSWVDAGVILAAKGLQVLVGAIGLAIDAWTTFKIILIGVTAGIEILVTWLKAQAEALMHPTKALDVFKAALEDAKRITADATEEIKNEIKANTDRQNALANVQVKVDGLVQKVQEADGVTHKATESTEKHTAALGMSAEAYKKAQEEAHKYTLAVQDEFDRIMKAEGIHKSVAESIKAEAEAAKLAADAAEDQARREEDAAAQVAHAVVTAAQEEFEANQRFVGSLRDIAGAINGLGGMWANIGANGVQAFANLSDKALRAEKPLQKVAGTVQGVTTALEAGAQASSKWGAAISGAASGAAAGAAFGPWGIAIGAVGGAILGLFGHAKKLREEQQKLIAQTNQARDAFIAEHGGLHALELEAAQASVSLDALFRARNPEEVKKAIEEIKGGLDTWNEAQKDLNDAVERYGFTIDELGPKFAQQKLDEQMGQIFQDWQLLTAAGVDHQAMLERIGPKVGEMVDQYSAAGVAIPQAMQPVIQDLYEHGALVHANGEAYTEAEYKALNFGQSTSAMFETLLEKIDHLVNALLGIPDKTTTVTVNTNYHNTTVDDHYDNYYSNHYDDGNGYAQGFEGWVMPRPGGTVMRVAEAGRAEHVSISRQGPGGGGRKRGGGDGGDQGPQTIVIPVSIGGQKIDSLVLRRQRAGWMVETS